jgi:hypothetical protein
MGRRAGLGIAQTSPLPIGERTRRGEPTTSIDGG